ncbi:hypothetical protein BH24ACT22_BH24ACT22_19930 [soil metagenome]
MRDPKTAHPHRIRIFSGTDTGTDKKTVGKKLCGPYISVVRETRATYRQRRIGALLVVAILAFALYAGGNAGAESPTIHHTVDPGETLWEITVEYYPPSEDPRPLIEEIREINGLGDYDIQVGMALELPPVE